jgi:26S proteasome regulatory subunit N1
LAGEISQEWDARQSKEGEKPDTSDLLALVDEIVPYDMSHNAEHEAVDLLLEVELLDRILPHVDENNFDRVCLYLTSCSNYVPEPDDATILKVTYEIYKKMKQYPSALRIALKTNDKQLVKGVFESCDDRYINVNSEITQILVL